MTNRPPQFDPLTSASPPPRRKSRLLWPPNDWFGPPVELPPRVYLTNDPTQWEPRSWPATEREMREELERDQHQSPFG